jgi:hypothetical protein
VKLAQKEVELPVNLAPGIVRERTSQRFTHPGIVRRKFNTDGTPFH